MAALVLALASAAPRTARGERNFYVAANGDDAWTGALPAPNDEGNDGPFATLERARLAVRGVIDAGLTERVAVHIRAGVYHLERTLELTPEDSGTADHPITWRAYAGETPVLRGGRVVTGWTSEGGGVYVADLRAQGLGDVFFHQLFYQGRRQILARHPNLDPDFPRSKGFLYMDTAGPIQREQFHHFEGDIPWHVWGSAPQAEIATVFNLGWNFAIARILAVDPARQLVTTDRLRSTYREYNRFYVMNLAPALDAPGEWFHDRASGLLRFIPPDGLPPGDDVMVPTVDAIVATSGVIPFPHGYLNTGYQGRREDFPWPDDAPTTNAVEHVHFRGLTLEGSRQDGFRLVGSRHCSVTACAVSGVGNVGINLGGTAPSYAEVGNPRAEPSSGFEAGAGGGGQIILFNDPCHDCRVEGCDVWQTGVDGIMLYGARNVAENNHVYDIGLYDKDAPCINLYGEANVARRNTLHDCPRCGVFLKGVDNVVECNDVHHTNLETRDMGGIRMVQRNVYLVGNIIRYNRVFDTIGYGYYNSDGHYASPQDTWGIYMDDFTGGTHVHGNLVARVPRGGAHVHGGSDNIVENNVFVDCEEYQFEINPIRDEPCVGNYFRRNVVAYDGLPALLYGFGTWTSDEQGYFRDNVVWPGADAPESVHVAKGRNNILEGWVAWLAEGHETGSVIADPFFVDAANDDYRLRPESPAFAMGFEALPTSDSIGCYESPERASWPLETYPGFVREELYLPTFPVKPMRETFERDIAGAPPRNGVSTTYANAPLEVTDELAFSGRQCLRVQDNSGLRNAYEPHIYYQLDFTSGTVLFSADFLLDGDTPPDVWIEFRQYSDAGTWPYYTGPNLMFTPEGELVVNGSAVGTVPHDRWFHLAMPLQLGVEAPDVSELTLSIVGEPVTRYAVAHRNTEFDRLERIVITSNADHVTLYHADNLFCVPAGDAPATATRALWTIY